MTLLGSFSDSSVSVFFIYIYFRENIVTLVFLTHVSVFFFLLFFSLTCRLAGNSSSQNETLTGTKVRSVQISAGTKKMFMGVGENKWRGRMRTKLWQKKKKNFSEWTNMSCRWEVSLKIAHECPKHKVQAVSVLGNRRSPRPLKESEGKQPKTDKKNKIK